MPMTRPQALAQLQEAARQQLALLEGEGGGTPVAGDPDSFSPAEFEAAATKFVAAMQDHSDQYMRKHHPGNKPYKIGVDKGPKYWRVWKSSHGDDKSTVGFIDKTTGFLLKADGWKKPAKGPRGSVFADSPSKFGAAPTIA